VKGFKTFQGLRANQSKPKKASEKARKIE
jgi:hypothetical protein